MGQTADEISADAEPMSSVQDLLPPDVRLALAELVATRQPGVTGDLGDDLPEHEGDRADGEGRVQRERHPAPPSQQNHVARQRPVERPHRKPRACFNVRVMRHARERARERFPGFKAARIVDEVHAALVAGRVSPVKPPGMIGGDFPYGLYAWTEEGDRVYGIRYGEDCFAVHTTMRRGVPE
jgi:hypothetical protein